ncbi:putative structural protein [Erwinia phage pEa_SNUABM_50]|uniref:Uncharacterized protein n=4 Tax=Eneladusvirus BF TaxID=2560751 RepID=A0A1S6UB17_9CAUD|nr:virion structural protein [Serratia phage BF]QOI71305.1 putative structural protein [Erwinia phage pEa_SNUABM_12]QOI71848.1 putative structural protein [Erwinia phage pEa_SNUABM_47]QOI72387.1 putative structural protein [Erwinia phage pEa_SNUABM_50]QXO11514.1 hypothetical protein pEaSNUABM19_00368 [Erwinia phage pEa_SNUABM_19]QXO12062.1 hypothetical protein pEaSNUABM44_00366 [Erwinia phage pEa_SNUABM_44]QXO12615.1 hypothetical protein pEaSNUABM49_00369 [Erwinia phage pEa_SNUABM_49]
MTVKNKEFILRCECHELREHSIHVAQYNTGDEYDDANIGQCLMNMSMEIRLPWYKRVWVGIKYMFGSTDHVHFMDTMVDVEVLKDLVQKLDDNRTDEQKAAAKESRDWSKFEIL